MPTEPSKSVIEMTTEIVARYLDNNQIEAEAVAPLIREVHGALHEACWSAMPEATTSRPGETKVVETTAEPEILPPIRQTRRQPAVAIKESVTDDHIFCLEDGQRFVSMKQHLRNRHSLTPEQYREKWGLPADYPMVAPNYSKIRKQIYKAKVEPRFHGHRKTVS